jgi:hypothetical protein
VICGIDFVSGDVLACCAGPSAAAAGEGETTAQTSKATAVSSPGRDRAPACAVIERLLTKSDLSRRTASKPPADDPD